MVESSKRFVDVLDDVKILIKTLKHEKAKKMEENNMKTNFDKANFLTEEKATVIVVLSKSSEARYLSGQFGGTPNFMLPPLKEQLVEKYFHPDNISSSEKPKHELQKVRDEFKMSESDCGSARVQCNTF
ncbi:hypothetical protein LOK49_LG14G01628 [Camellia lanceoleosa]|uniref:Uncharacterized protein n=1 Tax=Camellia lanceoleosa TaxID=1840588 RepID=A0ACC0FCS9_9ERIC|nr:hypothetical protein LOK49_LG14G01628 [Camellia lanceoleosa]